MKNPDGSASNGSVNVTLASSIPNVTFGSRAWRRHLSRPSIDVQMMSTEGIAQKVTYTYLSLRTAESAPAMQRHRRPSRRGQPSIPQSPMRTCQHLLNGCWSYSCARSMSALRKEVHHCIADPAVLSTVIMPCISVLLHGDLHQTVTAAQGM